MAANILVKILTHQIPSTSQVPVKLFHLHLPIKAHAVFARRQQNQPVEKVFCKAHQQEGMHFLLLRREAEPIHE